MNDIFPGSEITVDPATINLSAAALKMGNTREQLNMNDIQPENTSFPYSQSGDDISIMTPSTISSDDADLDFSSDEEGSERGHELDFSRLTAPPRKKERKSLLAENKNNEIATEQIIDDLDHSNKLERAFGSRDHQVNGSDACVAISPSQSVGDNSTSSEEVVMYQVDTIDDDDSTVTNDEDNDDEDADDDDDDDDESIEWAPTPVKACGEPNDYFAESLTSQASSVNTFGNLMEKFNHIEDRSPPKVRMKDDILWTKYQEIKRNFVVTAVTVGAAGVNTGYQRKHTYLSPTTSLPAAQAMTPNSLKTTSNSSTRKLETAHRLVTLPTLRLSAQI